MKKGTGIILVPIVLLAIIYIIIKTRAVAIAIWMLIFLAGAVGVVFLYYRRLTAPMRETKRELDRRKAQDEARSKPVPVREPAPKPVERKYRPAPIHTPRPPPPPKHRRSVDVLRREHSNLSGEEVFERLKRHTRRKRRR